MSWNWDDNDFEFEVEKEVEFESELEFDVEVDLKKDVDIDIKVDSDVDLDGNFASITFDATAIGSDTIAEADVSALTIEGELSEVAGVIIAASD